jgi:F-box interacting protein
VKERQAKMSSRDLPEDVIIEILSRLPVKWLLRYKCVCKSWYALITNPDFINKHLTWATSHNPRRGLFLTCEHEITRTPLVFLRAYETLEGSRYVDISQFFPHDIDDLGVYGPCNGIFCLHGGFEDRDDPLVLWNPATRESKALPVIHRPPEVLISFNFGFGFDPKANDYKVVRILNFSSLKCEVEVYSLRTDSWRVINQSLNPTYRVRSPRFPSYSNGVHHWWACDLCNRDSRFLLSFDMSNEVFQETPFPPLIERSPLFPLFEDIAVINDSVALVSVYYGREVKCYDIWVMNECGVKGSWTKLFTFGPLPLISRLLELREGGLVLLRNENGWLVVFDPIKREQRDLGIYGNSFQVVNSFTETLVLLNRSRECNVLQQPDQQQGNSGDGYESFLGPHQQDSAPFQ